MSLWGGFQVPPWWDAGLGQMGKGIPPGLGSEGVVCVPVWKDVTVPMCVSHSPLGTTLTAYTLIGEWVREQVSLGRWGLWTHTPQGESCWVGQPEV